MLFNKESYGNEFQEMKAYAKYFHRNNKCMNHESFS